MTGFVQDGYQRYLRALRHAHHARLAALQEQLKDTSAPGEKEAIHELIRTERARYQQRASDARYGIF